MEKLVPGENMTFASEWVMDKRRKKDQRNEAARLAQLVSAETRASRRSI